MPQLFLTAPDTHWLFAGRFVVYVLAIVLMIGCVRDIIEFRKVKAQPVQLAYQFTVMAACAAIIFSSPAKYHVLRRLFKIPAEGLQTDVMLMVGILFSIGFFIFAQITRAINRGVPVRRVRYGVCASLVAIILLGIVGVGIDVRVQ